MRLFFLFSITFLLLPATFCSNGKENLGAVKSSKNEPRIYIELRHVMATEIVISNCLATEISQNKRCAPISCGHWWDLFGLGLRLSLQLLQLNEFIVNKIHKQKNTDYPTITVVKCLQSNQKWTYVFSFVHRQRSIEPKNGFTNNLYKCYLNWQLFWKK